MTTTKMKKEILKSIEFIQNEDLIKAIYLLLNSEVNHINNTLSPMSIDEFYNRQTKSLKDIKSGRLSDSSKIKAKYSAKLNG
jgi:hypothetical protein